MPQFLYSIPVPSWLDMNAIIIITATATVVGILSIPLFLILASYIVYTKVLRRETPEKWNGNPADIPESQLGMYEAGGEWHEKNVKYKKDVHIINNGLNLYGEYYDYGAKSAVIIMSGRTESHTYGYFFAVPYSEAGLNVLVLDPRAHGKSDGEFNTIGFEESKDVLAWAEYIHREFNVEAIIFHGICIGSAGAIYALTHEKCPDYIRGMVAEGMFANFNESMKNHLRERKKPTNSICFFINIWMKHYTGHTMKYGPIDVMPRMTKPLLMIHSKADTYSTPENAQKLYDLCPSERKAIVWFDEGAHSMLRVAHAQAYDLAIRKFLYEGFEPRELPLENRELLLSAVN